MFVLAWRAHVCSRMVDNRVEADNCDGLDEGDACVIIAVAGGLGFGDSGVVHYLGFPEEMGLVAIRNFALGCLVLVQVCAITWRKVSLLLLYLRHGGQRLPCCSRTYFWFWASARAGVVLEGLSVFLVGFLEVSLVFFSRGEGVGLYNAAANFDLGDIALRLVHF